MCKFGTMKPIDKKIKRAEQVKSGLYDGRYKERIVPDKKKQQRKKWARRKD